MATKEQYESRLLSLDASKFEDLICDLLEKEFPVLHNLTHTGKVSGKLAARKGTPDIWFTTTLDDKEKFVFVEVTTQQNTLTSKIQSDLDKCKEHIKEKELAVEKIIYACLGKITPNEFECYQQFCQDFCRGRDSSFEFWGIDYIVHLLKVKYPVLAHEYLGIAIENGSVVEIGEYKNKFGVTEENKFLFRQDEIARAEEILLSERCVILSGSAGCGKTRMALEIMRSWERDDRYTSKILKLSGIGIENDLKALLDDTTKKYVILIDDANRISHLGNLINFAEHYSNIYLILTIRDYALKDIIVSLGGTIKSITLEPLTAEQIKDVLREGFNATNETFLKQAIDVSRGNLRFAIMMAEASLGKNNIKTIPELLDVYFSTLKQDLKEIINNSVYGKVLAAFALFKRIYIKDTAFVGRITNAFEISEGEFLDACDVLEQQELLNYHFDNAIAEIADQILAEHLFYQVVISKNKVDLTKIFDEFFFGRKKQKNRILELFRALFRSYGADQKILQRLTEYKDVLKSRADNYDLMEFYLSFCDMFGIEVLAFAERILCDINITDGLRDKALNLLAEFCDTDNYQYAIDALLREYKDATKKYKEEISKHLVDRYAMTPESYTLGYECQKYLITKAVEFAKDAPEYESLLYSILKKHFPPRHEYTTATHKNITIYKIPLIYSPASKSYRDVVWGAIRYLLFQAKNHHDITEIINYGYYSDDDYKLRKYDKAHAISLFDNLNLTVLEDKILGLHLLGYYRLMNGAKERIKSLKADPIIRFYAENINHSTGKHSYGEAFEKQVLKLMKSGADYQEIIISLSCMEVLLGNHNAWNIGEAITYAFNYVFQYDKGRYLDILELLLNTNSKTQCQPYKILSNALEIVDAYTLLRIIDASSLERKVNWKMQVYIQVKEAQLTDQIIAEAFDFITNEYINATISWGNERATNFLHYEKKQKGFILSVCQVYFEKHRETFAFKTFCEALFMNWEPIEEILTLFDGNLALMESVYFELIARNTFCDYDAVFARYFIEKNPALLNKFFELYISKISEHISVKFLYSADNIVDAMLSYIGKKEYFYLDYHLGRFIQGLPEEKFEEFVIRFVERYKNEGYEMFEISNIMEECSKERQKHFIKVLIKENLPLTILQEMRFFDGPHSWSNSRVPYIQANIKALSELLEEEKGIMPVRYFDFFSERLRGLEKLLKSTQIEEFNEDFGV